jgi:signal transduction histidine kinase
VFGLFMLPFHWIGLTQERALLFGGDVAVNGSPGHGTRVSVTIPLRKSQ